MQVPSVTQTPVNRDRDNAASLLPQPISSLIPNDVIMQIFSYLPTHQIVQLHRLNKAAHVIINTFFAQRITNTFLIKFHYNHNDISFLFGDPEEILKLPCFQSWEYPLPKSCSLSELEEYASKEVPPKIFRMRNKQDKNEEQIVMAYTQFVPPSYRERDKKDKPYRVGYIKFCFDHKKQKWELITNTPKDHRINIRSFTGLPPFVPSSTLFETPEKNKIIQQQYLAPKITDIDKLKSFIAGNLCVFEEFFSTDEEFSSTDEIFSSMNPVFSQCPIKFGYSVITEEEIIKISDKELEANFAPYKLRRILLNKKN